jgi:alpha-L-rhamnosidase
LKAIHLRTEYLKEPLGLGCAQPRLYWHCEGGITQTAYEIKGSVDEAAFTSGKVIGSSMTHIPFPVKLNSRNYVKWQVRLWDEEDKPGDWSEYAHFEMGLLKQSDWQAKWITSSIKPKKQKNTPVDCFQKTFFCEEVEHARIYACACGIYELSLNGNKVGDIVLAPGATDINKCVQYQTYDVTDLLRNGENTLTAQLAPGWLYSQKQPGVIDYTFGRERKLLVQLEITKKSGKKDLIVSDDSWDWSNDGPILFADNKGGEEIDAQNIPSYNEKARVTNHNVMPTASDNVPIREHERFKAKKIITPSGSIVLDFKQNIAGFVEFNLNAKVGQTITLYMGEFLEKKEFTQTNINPKMVGNKASIQPFQKIVYHCKEGINHYKTKFAIFGFQYVLVESDVLFDEKDFTAIAVYSDMEDCLTFASDHNLLNRFVECTRWSGKNNSADVPTDCPQRERAGWTGDAQIFYQTATYFFDYAAFGRKYIHDIIDAQWSNGSFTQMAPRPKMNFYMRVLDGSVGWSDAGVYIPYRMWKLYGDQRIISECYDAMARYANFMISRCGKAPLFMKKPPISKENRKYLVMKGMSYGEWIEPKELVNFDVKEIARPHIEESTAYTAYTMRCMAEIAHYLNKPEESRWQEYARGCKQAYEELIKLPEYSLDTNRQAKLVRPLYFSLLNNDDTNYTKKRLIQALDFFDWRVGTGFLSTPFILYVLEDINPKYAYKLLENEKIPGWLAMPKNGATTIWESWEGIYGNPVESLDHYSKGAVCEWIFARMCGVRVYKENTFEISPVVEGSIKDVRMSWCSPYGIIISSWHRSEKETHYHFEIPANTTAKLTLPTGISKTLMAGIYDFNIVNKEKEH